MITSAHPVCVVIPVYTTDLSPAEWLSLDQCVSVLRNHPIVIAKPDSLDITPLTRRHAQLRQESFRDAYFASIQGYNRMMLSDEFYARFAAYEFILIHQLDAFVFSDQLLYWCERGYDYIGAPWIAQSNIPSRASLMRAAVRRRLFRLIGKRYRNQVMDHHAQQHYSAGNGGFSLRRVGKMREILSRLSTRVDDYRESKRSPWAEDIFFSIEANRYRKNLRIPGFAEATNFAWETYPRVAAHFATRELPFGCHAWNKLHRDDWQPIFSGIGFSIDKLLE